MSNNKPLQRGVDGVCTRSTCECEREGLGDQCVWLKPADRRPAPGCRTPEGCRENGCLGWCDEHRPEAAPDSKTPNVGGNRLAPTQEQR